MKKYKWAFLLLLSLLFFVTACSPANAPATSDGTAGADTVAADTASEDVSGGSNAGGDDEVVVALIPSDMSDPNLVYIIDRQKAYCEERGYQTEVFDPQGNSQTQANMISNVIAQGVDAIVVDCCDTLALGTSFMEAKDAGVITITYNGDIGEEYREYRDAFAGADDTAVGVLAAECFKDVYGDTPTNIAIIEGAAGANAQIRRSDGFDKGLEGTTNFTILDKKACTTWSTSEAMTIAEDYIVKFGDDLDSIYCHWDNGAVGVAEALKAADYEPGDVFMVSTDGCYNGFDLVREGWSYACIMQDFDEMSLKTIELIETLLAGGEVEPINYTTLITITKDNVDDYDPGW